MTPSNPQNHRRQMGHITHYERQTQYPKGVKRQSPRSLKPKLPEGESARYASVCIEHLNKPNQFLYLYRIPAPKGGVLTFRWYTSDGEFYDRHQHRTIYQAIIKAHESGWIDATWG